MKINIKDISKIESALLKANGKATSHTITNPITVNVVAERAEKKNYPHFLLNLELVLLLNILAKVQNVNHISIM